MIRGSWTITIQDTPSGTRETQTHTGTDLSLVSMIQDWVVMYPTATITIAHRQSTCTDCGAENGHQPL